MDPQPQVSDMLETLRPSVLSRARRRAWHADVEDAVQEALCRALARDDLRVDGLEAWLGRVTANILADDGRRLRYSTPLAAEHLPEEVVPDPTEEVIDHQTAHAMLERLSRLSEIQRDILLSLADGQSIQQIACRKGVTPRSVEGHLRRARKTLRRSIQ